MADTKKTSSTKTQTQTKAKSTTKKPSTTQKKTTTKKPATSTSKKTSSKSTTVASTTKKPVVKKTTKPKKTTKKTASQVKKEIVTKEAVQKVFEGEQRKRRGKTFYLLFSIVFLAGTFFYINNILYDDGDYLQSALFSVAALFVVFMLLNFNIHMIVINFFRLPFKYLFTEAKMEINKDIIEDPEEKGVNKKFNKVRAIFTLLLYFFVLLLLVGSQIYNGIMDDDKVLVIITQSLLTGFIFLVIVCSWQYIFNIIPSILENTIDARNGFILTLSAIVMIIYVVFIIFDITFLSELMIFILIVGFTALLGVNLNMIIGEFNIFKNLRSRSKKSKTVTRMVFTIFFSFHLYIILYASVVAYSIYVWEPDAYNFINYEYEEVLVEDLEYNDVLVTEVYDGEGNLITSVYDINGNEITDVITSDGKYIKQYYDSLGNTIEFYMSPTDIDPITELQKDYTTYYLGFYEEENNHFIFIDGTLKGVEQVALPHTYGDMLYYAVITISSVGFGDISPNSNYPISQFWGGFLSIYGLTFYALSIGYVSNIAGMGLSERRDEED